MTEDEAEAMVGRLASYHRCLVSKCTGDMAEGWNTGRPFIGMAGTFVFVRFYGEDMVDCNTFAGIIEAYLSNRIAYYSLYIAYYSLYGSSLTTEQMLFEDAMKSWKKERIGAATTEELELKLAAMGY